MRGRPIVQLVVRAILLFVLFGAICEPAQANTYLGLAIVTASGDTGPSISLSPRAADRCDPSTGFDWVVRMTVVVIALSGSIGALGSYLTRAAPPRSRIA
jgi:hypothetical protein